ncbi:hypothetical protein PIB30_036317 [Stylosanthes scabra]|uniref:Uncharacterized protein n=1 Tax=Stylosanthes scabra TaxID=79078 RepID=A0ABU6TD36_9FABA|nr:hypothetical protein [Stylosanthes scabra]
MDFSAPSPTYNFSGSIETMGAAVEGVENFIELLKRWWSLSRQVDVALLYVGWLLGGGNYRKNSNFLELLYLCLNLCSINHFNCSNVKIFLMIKLFCLIG